MKTASKKAKGRKLQDFVRDTLLTCFDSLEEDDIKSAIMGESGEDIKLSPAARRAIPYSFECKNQGHDYNRQKIIAIVALLFLYSRGIEVKFMLLSI